MVAGASVAAQERSLTLPTQGVTGGLGRYPRSAEPRACLGRLSCRTGVRIVVAEAPRYATGIIARRSSLE